MDQIHKVFEFNRLIGVNRTEVTGLSLKEFQWLYGACQEELEELDEAHTAGDVVDQVDALIDLAYFALGGLARLGLSHHQAQACFELVHQANMMKKQGVKEGRTNDGSVPDAFKPEGWVDPKTLIRAIVEAD